MPRLVPPEPDFASTAERTVWEILATQLPAEAALLAGQRITAEGNEIEIDLLVLWPDVGVAVIEVKGGLVSVVDGTWWQSDRSGKRVLDPSPVEQAQRAKHELLDWVNKRSSRPIGRAIHLVALPYTTLSSDWDVPDAPPELVLDSADVEQAAGRIVNAMNAFGSSRYPPLDAQRCEHTIKSLRCTHASITNLQRLAAEIEDTGNILSRDQERVIDLLRYQNRAQIVGGAGSGKTQLAIIKSRRLAKAGQRTALLCYSRGLARHFQLLATHWPRREQPAFVGLFHDLPVSWGAKPEHEFNGPVSDYYEEYLPRRLRDIAEHLPEADRFDAIVVDEAQDFADLWWSGLRMCLRNWQDDVLYAFADAHQSVFDRDGAAPITLNPFPLDDNLRNTRRIADIFSSLTPINQRPLMDVGEPVRFISASTDTAADSADDVIDTLLDDGWEPGDIALLTTGKRHPEQVAQIELSGHDGYWDEFFSGDAVFYGHVLNFKGLERRVVVLAVNGFHSPERAPHLLYVGLSRARSLLVVVADEEELFAVGGNAVADTIIQ